VLSDDSVGVVVIGRNEGERLRRCLHAVVPLARQVVYVDSGSNDGSVAMARSLGVHVVELDLSVPFTAARARNAGFAALRERARLPWVQFLDGDCEVAPGWLEAGVRFLASEPRVAAVSGRLRERAPQASLYNRLCDDEWNTPVGAARHCGGNAMHRSEAFAAVGGFREDLIAGEEPELCVRLREAGWRIWRIDAEMALHDAAMTRFSQWWRRAVRSGYAFAQGAHLHGAPPERHWVWESRRAWLWGAAIPLAALLAGGLVGWRFGMLLLLAYPAQVLRRALALRSRWSGLAWTAAVFESLSRFAEMRGQWMFLADRLRGGRRGLVEYK
jgi:GT2 family glycosyltransferase